MKILSLHCDYLRFKPLKKAISEPEELASKEEVEVKEPLGIFIAVEKQDETDLKKAISELVSNIQDLRARVKADTIVLYPYAHLSSDLANPRFAQEVLEGTEGILKKKKIRVHRAPFGYYKSFELKCKGHPLAELSRQISFGSEKEIIEFCKQHLASFKKPTSVDFIEEMPKTGPGKIDKKRLKELYWKDMDRQIR